MVGWLRGLNSNCCILTPCDWDRFFGRLDTRNRRLGSFVVS